jgi:aspartate aminotransferase
MTPDRMEVDEAFAPLERFAALHAQAWRRQGGIFDLSFPNPRTDRDGRAMDRLRTIAAEIDQHDLQYTPFGGRTVARRKVAATLSQRASAPVAFADVFLTPGATAALVVAMAALFRAGDEVLIVTPSWMDYELYLGRLGVRAVRVPSGPDKKLDVAAVQARCGPRTAGLILSQPACPTGVVHSATTLRELSETLDHAGRASGRRIILISDEVHRDQVWDDDATLTLPMRLYPDTVSIYSFGKAWSLQGQRTGYLALGRGLQTQIDRRRVDRALRATGVCAPTALMQRLVGDIASWVPDHRALQADQARMRRGLLDIGYEVIPGQATSFVYVRCPPGKDDWAFVEALSGHGVLAMPSSLFHEPDHFRLALNSASADLSEIIRRFHMAFVANAAGRPL